MEPGRNRRTSRKEISYGEQRQIDLILAMAVQPKVLLLDEPTAGLSAAEVMRVVAWSAACPEEHNHSDDRT